MNQEQTAIREQRHRWIAAINAGSADDFVAALTEDAVWLPSTNDAICGREEIRAWLEKPFAELDYRYSVSVLNVRLAGDWAVEQARFSTRARSKSGQAMPRHEGLYTLLWRRAPSGTWLIERYVDHSADFRETG